MAKSENQELKIEMKFSAIELLSGSLNMPLASNLSNANFKFNVGIETKTDPTNKLVFVIVNIDIRNDDQSLVLGSISTSSIFEIANFEEVIKIHPDGRVEISQVIMEVLNSISISTSRGVMFSTFKGTFLHNAILPIIDPKQFKLNPILEE